MALQPGGHRLNQLRYEAFQSRVFVWREAVEVHQVVAAVWEYSNREVRVLRAVERGSHPSHIRFHPLRRIEFTKNGEQGRTETPQRRPRVVEVKRSVGVPVRVIGRCRPGQVRKRQSPPWASVRLLQQCSILVPARTGSQKLVPGHLEGEA